MKSVRVAISIALGLSALAPAVAHAYPPGQNISVSLSQSMVKPGTSLNASVTNAKPGSVTIKLGTLASTAVAGANRLATGALKPTKSGVYIVSVTDTAATANTTSTTLYVPEVTFPKPVKVGVKATLTIKYAKPGTAVTVKIGSKTFKGTVAASNKVDIKITVPKKGSNTVTVNVGPLKSMSYSGKVTGK